MRIFISYARVDKPYCVQIAEMLEIHETWYDQRLYAGQDWWKEILQRLDWCEGFIYLMSPDSLSSEYCQKEYFIAQRIGKPIFPVLIHPEAQIPDILAKLQYVDLSRGLTPDSTRALLNAIFVTERSMNYNGRSQPQHMSEANALTTTNGDNHNANVAAAEVHDPAAVIGKAAEAMEAGDYDGAVFLLRRALETGYRSRFIDLNGLLNEAEAALERQTRLREIEREYQSIAELIKRRRTRAHGCQALAAFRKVVPDYDPENLIELCADIQAAQTVRTESLPRISSKPRFSLPLLEWCSISGGNVILSDQTHAGSSTGKSLHFTGQSQYVEPFRIAKYPITNVQYQIFVDDADGYSNPKWWGYSAFAQAWRSSNPKPADSQFKGEERPRENVTWFEAMAYCFWLSEKMDLPIMLPTKQQWRRAAQGDDGRIYPWGNEFDTSFCNTRESRIRMTTLVMRYNRGVSPFGVYDMAGNVWEWCLNSAYDDLAITTDRPRAVQGGSFIGAHERAQINFSFDLAPDYHYGSIGFRLACALDS